MAAKTQTFAEFARRIYEPTKHETRMLLNAVSGDSRFAVITKPGTWDSILEYINTAAHPDVTKDAFRLVWLSYGAYKRRMGKANGR